MPSRRWPDETTCYACDAPWVSEEHAPPKCVFPKKRDSAPDENFRTDLLIVPSCDQHNSNTSADDEYVWAQLLAGWGADPEMMEKGMAALIRGYVEKPGKLETNMPGLTPIKVPVGGTEKESAIYRIDFARIERTMRKIAQALIYARSGHRVKVKAETLRVFHAMGLNLESGGAPHEGIPKRLDDAIEYHWAETPHPRVFSYDFFMTLRPEPAAAFRFWFYRDVRYDVVSESIARQVVPSVFWSPKQRKKIAGRLQAKAAALQEARYERLRRK